MILEGPEDIYMHIIQYHESSTIRDSQEGAYYTDGTYVLPGGVSQEETFVGARAFSERINFFLYWALYSGVYLSQGLYQTTLIQTIYEDLRTNYHTIFDTATDEAPELLDAAYLDMAKLISKLFVLYTDKNKRLLKLVTNDNIYDIFRSLFEYTYVGMLPAVGFVEVYLRALSKFVISGIAKVNICPLVGENGPGPTALLVYRGVSWKGMYAVEAQCDIGNQDKLKPYVDSGLYGNIYNKYFLKDTVNRF